MKKLLGVLILLLFPTLLRAQCTGSSPTWTSTPDQASLSSCVSRASAGDTINVAAGTVTWTLGIVINKALSIIGVDASSVIITDNIPTNASPTGHMFSVVPTVVGSLVRISGMAFLPGPNTYLGAIAALGTCNSSGCTNIRVDHTVWGLAGGPYWNGKTINISYGMNVIDNFFGVIDHNTINGNPAGSYLPFAESSHGNYLGLGSYGDNSWALPEMYGTANFLFFEDNTFNSSGCCENEGNAGSYQDQGGGRIVARHNAFNIQDGYNFTLGWHGSESSGRPRGGRAFEYYQNTITYPTSCVPSGNCAPTIAVRSGTGLAWGNTINAGSHNYTSVPFGFNSTRIQGSPGGWGACDGTEVEDDNDPNAGLSNPKFTGTIASVTKINGAAVVTVNGSPGWSTNQWVPYGAPYSMHDITETAANGGAAIGEEILSNTSNVLTVNFAGGPGAVSPVAGDSISITRAFACLDQGGGRGAARLYAATNTQPFTVTANEISSPAYLWMNAYTNVAPVTYVGADTARVIQNRDFYAENVNQSAQTSPTSPFNGTTGVGHGTLANRPTSCTSNSWNDAWGIGPKGTAYWETDNNQLDFCLAGGTWSTLTSSPASYVPYTYPHPLTTGASGDPPPNPPTGLAATVK